MADLIRPELAAALGRWREVLSGGAVAGAGLWLGLAFGGFLSWIGWLMVPLGAALAYTGVQHLRFRSGGGGPGVVEVTERRVIYYGPLTGGMADMDLLARLDLDPTAHPAHWLLTAETGAVLSIPVNAAGSEALFDLFAALPGIRTEAMLTALQDGTRGAGPGRRRAAGPITLWEAGPARLT